MSEILFENAAHGVTVTADSMTLKGERIATSSIQHLESRAELPDQRLIVTGIFGAVVGILLIAVSAVLFTLSMVGESATGTAMFNGFGSIGGLGLIVGAGAVWGSVYLLYTAAASRAYSLVVMLGDGSARVMRADEQVVQSARGALIRARAMQQPSPVAAAAE